VTLLLEPVTAALLAAIRLGERLAPTGLLGGALVLVAIATVGRPARAVGRTAP
jgi:DME family drug/metabolite transporter